MASPAQKAARRPRRLSASAEPLEARALMTAVPTDGEQYMLALINRARANPAAEGQRLVALARTDPILRAATAGEDLGAFLREIDSFAPEPPLAFNPRLVDAARNHDAVMLADNGQHHSPDGYLNDPTVAVDSDGQVYFDTTNVSWATGENIFAYASNLPAGSNLLAYVNYFYEGFMLDWGNPDFGHLTNILAPGPAESTPSGHVPYSEVGVGLLTGVQPTTPPDPNPDNPGNGGLNVGPDLVTQEFGWRDDGLADLTGVVSNDADRNGFFSPGEGRGGVTIRAVGLNGQGTFSTQTWSTGGYTLPLPPGSYNVTASGGQLPGTRSTVVTIGGDNVGWSVTDTPASQADLPVVADYTGDGKADLATYNPTAAVWTVRSSADASIAVTQFGQGGVDLPVPGKYDGGGKSELAVYRPTTGQWFIRGPSGDRMISFGWAGHDVPVPADYDGNGTTDIAVYRPETGQWFIRTQTGGTQVVNFGEAGVDEPVVADYDGDGKADIAVFRPTTAEWFIRRSTDGGTTDVLWGWAGHDVPRPADYDGDGKADIAIFRPESGLWAIRQSSGGGRTVTYGSPGDQAVPANYDGDGKADLAVFTPGSAVWTVSSSANGSTSTTTFGQSGAATTALATFGKYLTLPRAWYDLRIPSAAAKVEHGIATPKGPRWLFGW